MYFSNTLFSKTQLFLYFFLEGCFFLPFCCVFKHVNQLLYCYIGIFLCFFSEFFQIQ